MPLEPPATVQDLTAGYLSGVAAKMLGDPSLEVMRFALRPDPFEFPRFGDKQFFEIPFDYRGRGGEGRSTMILRVLPPMDAVMMLTGDREHRELKAFETGLLAMVPPSFHIPFVDVVHRPERDQYWVFMEDVRPDMERLGMTEELDDETLRLILSHLAAFQAAFWEKKDVLSQPWLMRLEQPVDYFYRCIVDILDGMEDASEASRYMVDKWPWLREGLLRFWESLAPETRRWAETLYREPERLLEKLRPLPRTLCHYDFDNRNLGLREGPDGAQTVVIDWEIVGEGLSPVDVGRFLAYQQPPNTEDLLAYFLDELDRRLGRRIDRDEWFFTSDLVTVAIWQIIGVQFGVLVNTPTSPVPPEQREGLRRRVYSDVAHVDSLVRKYALA
jgi:aminoglycoside phosphotransferase (APT) family kinase protein